MNSFNKLYLVMLILGLLMLIYNAKLIVYEKNIELISGFIFLTFSLIIGIITFFVTGSKLNDKNM